jgi:hypothetical protein
MQYAFKSTTVRPSDVHQVDNSPVLETMIEPKRGSQVSLRFDEFRRQLSMGFHGGTLLAQSSHKEAK